MSVCTDSLNMTPSKLTAGEAAIQRGAGVGHFAAEGEGAIPRVALCGEPLRGVRSDKPLCSKCEAIRDAEWLEMLCGSGEDAMS